MSELIFDVVQEADGGFVAECLTEGIFTQADRWHELRENVCEKSARPLLPVSIFGGTNHCQKSMTGGII